MSLTILCPNGRRQTMKVNPNTSISEILEYVCEKQELDSKEYELTRNNKVLDLSLTIRFANIPNNGQLELKKASIARKDQKVTIAMDLEDGVRQIKEFESNQNLWDVIHVMFESNQILNLEPNKEFCIIYIGKEIVGEIQLKQTNLKSLGLAQGRAAMKLLVRPINALKAQAFVESLNLKKPSKESDNEKNNETDSHRIQQTNKELQNIITQQKVKQQTLPIDTPHNSESVPEVLEINDSDNQKIEQKESDIQKMEIQSEESSDENEEIVNFLGSNHKEIWFKMSDLPKVSKIEYPDHFYNTTKDDLIHVLTDLQKQQGTEKPLETKQMREQRKREQMKRYKSTVIRICVPNDKLIFQAVFKPTHTVEYVMQVLSHYINAKDFYLYTTPPKRELKPELSLYETDLVPAALIHFKLKGVESEQMVIKEEFKSKLTSFKSAAKIANSARLEGKPSDVGTTDPQITHTNPQTNPLGNTNADKKESTVPKWFKTNK